MSVDCKRLLQQLEEIKQRLKSVDSKNIEVGWFQEDEHNVPDDTHNPVRTMAQVAYEVEYGINKRPFVRQLLLDKQSEFKSNFNKTASKIIKGEDPDSLLNEYGKDCVNSIRDEIENGNHEDLSDVTLIVRHIRENRLAPITDTLVKNIGLALATGRVYNIKKGWLKPSSNDKPLQDTLQLYEKVKFKINKKNEET